MPETFWRDVRALLSFRAQPLVHYQYASSVVLLGIVLLSLGSVVVADPLNAPWAVRLLFFMALHFFEIVVFAWFMRWWLQRFGWENTLSLVGVILVAHIPQLFEFVWLLLPDALGVLCAIAGTIWSITALLHALHRMSGVAYWRLGLGFLISIYISGLWLILLVSVSWNLGWIQLPAHLQHLMPNDMSIEPSRYIMDSALSPMLYNMVCRIAAVV